MKVPFESLKGETCNEIVATDKKVIFKTNSGKVYKLYHEQDRCEEVYIEDICGDWNDLINEKILLAEETSEHADGKDKYDYGSGTYSFYKLVSNKGPVTIRFYGTSDSGYYSETADLYLVKEE